MKKVFFTMTVVMMILTTLQSMATSTITAGKYFLQNVATGLYLNNGASWGTHAIVNDVGLEFELEVGKGDEVLIINKDLYLSPDSDTQVHVWVDWYTPKRWNFHEISEGIYHIGISNSGNLTVGNDNWVILDSCTNEMSQWKLVTFEERLQTLNNATREKPIDATFLIQGANYFLANNEHDYWIGDHSENVWVHSELGSFVQIWNDGNDYYKPFNIHQNCNVKNGTYKLTVQGFYRAKYSYHFLVYGESETLDAILYANTKELPLVSLHTKENELERYRDDYWGLSCAWPGNGEAAADFFSEGLYLNTIDNIKVNNDVLTIGVRDNSTIQHGCWMTCANFRLYYYGDGTSSNEQKPEGDVNGDGIVNISDVIYLINIILNQ